MTEQEKTKKRLAFLEDKCATYIDRDIGLSRAINAIKNEQKKRFKEYVKWQQEIQIIRRRLKKGEVAE